jgi:purine-cytosine permease-like protein
VAVLTIIFTIAQYVSFIFTGVEQTTLIERWFTVVALELGLLMLKKLFEKKQKETENEDDAEH